MSDQTTPVAPGQVQRFVRISWRDSCNMPSRIHLTADGVETRCGGHAEYIANRRLVQSPRKVHGRSMYCRRCFSDGGKASPWDPRCIDANSVSGSSRATEEG
jgi:hypothetical protein